MATNAWPGKPSILCNPPISDIVCGEMPSKLQKQNKDRNCNPNREMKKRVESQNATYK
jgi:hypothetical protein